MKLRVIASAMILTLGGLTTTAVNAQAFSLPRSERIVEGEMYLPDGHVVNFVARDGTLITIRNEVAGYTIGLSPVVVDGPEQTVKWLQVRITEDANGQHVESLKRPYETSIGVLEFFDFAEGRIDVISHKVAEGNFPPAMGIVDLQQQGQVGPGICCVTCDEWTICGTSVKLYCGSCSAVPPATSFNSLALAH